MSVPTLTPLFRSPVARPLPASVRMFSVTRTGDFGGRRYDAGAVLLIEEDQLADGDAVVMAPTGFGGPQLGHIDGVGLVGGYGEPCSRQRWGVVGRVAGIAYIAGVEWAVEWFADAPAMPQLSQLSLFAA